MNYKTRRLSIVIIIVLILAAVVLFTGCVCPLFSIFERCTGLSISAGDDIDDSTIVDELIYPGSIALVQVDGGIERILELITTYGVSFSEEERQALEQLPENIRRQEVGAIVYSTANSRDKVLSYYDNLTDKGWQIESLNAPGSDIQENNIIVAVKEERRQVLVVTGSESNSFIVFIDFDWSVFGGEEG